MVLNVLCVRNFVLLKLMWSATGIRIIKLKYWYIQSLYISVHLRLLHVFSPSHRGYMHRQGNHAKEEETRKYVLRLLRCPFF